MNASSGQAVKFNLMPEGDQRSLSLYQKAVADLLDCRYLRTPHTYSFQTIGDESNNQRPDREDLRSFLMSLRVFTAQKDDTQFGQVANLILRYCGDPNTRDWVTYSRKLWNSTMKSSPFDFSQDEEPFTVERCLDLYFNTAAFHYDDDKTTQVDALEDSNRNLLEMTMMHGFAAMVHAVRIVNISIDLFRSDETAPSYPG